MADNYKIAIALAMSSNHNAILSALSAQLLGVHANVNRLTGGFNRLKLAIGGAFAVGAGVAILDTMTKLVEKTKDYSHELAKLETLGGPMAAAVNSGAVSKKAFDISQRVPMSVTDLMKIPGMMNSMLGTDEALSTWEDTAKLAFVMQSQKDYTGDPAKDLQLIMRSGELSGRITDSSGKIDDAKLKAYEDLVTRIIAATHGMVGSRDLLGMAQQGGTALRGLTDEGYYHMAIAAQAFGGNRAGTALMSTWQQLATGQMFTRTAEGLQEAGMLKSDDWHTDHGRVIISDEASKRLTAMIGNDPLVFAHKMDENLKAQGVTDPQDRQRMIMRGLGRATTQRFTLEEAQNYGQITAETDRMKQGYGALQSFDTFKSKDVEANMVALSKAWENLQTAIAGPNSSLVIQVLQGLTGAINSVQTAVLKIGPDNMKHIAEVLAGIAAALITLGTVAVVGAVGVPALLGALGVAIATLAALNWSTLEHGFAILNGGIDGLINLLAHPLDSLFGHDPAHGSSPGKDGKPWHPTMFEPGGSTPRAAPSPIQLSLNVDGRTLASALSRNTASAFDSQAPAQNGLEFFPNGDHQHTD